ncbi:MAG: helix-turn-helix transcriptional regulator [Clostridia bacterium]|nr:helix-turn-helix transcriptional regulator [Clostridia bacterium]
MDFVFSRDLKKILLYLDQHFREDIGVQDCANLVGYSPWYTGRLFKRCFGESIADYLRKLRMNAAKEELKTEKSIKEVAESLSYSSPAGFSRAFKDYFGVLPSEYLQGAETTERYEKEFDYRIPYSDWMKGENSSYKGIWEYAYYDPKTQEYSLMNWTGARWEAPFDHEGTSDPRWYCRNRSYGYGLHPGKEIQAVRTFRCPRDGVVDVLFVVGRFAKLKNKRTPVGVQLFHNGTLLVPDTGMIVLQDIFPISCRATCRVRKGDRISLHVDSMGDINRSGLHLYRQWIGYRKVNG